jgi:hypothetical protein
MYLPLLSAVKTSGALSTANAVTGSIRQMKIINEQIFFILY